MRTLWLIGLAAALAGAPLLPAAVTAPQAKDFFIIVTGGELLEGALADAHTPYITKTLLPLGMKCVGMMIVDDLDDDLIAAYRYATNKAQLVIVTGGLGPTDNDITRETLARCTGIPVREDPDLVADMARRFNTPVAELRANLRRQTQIPVSGGYFKNSSGSAVGLIYSTHELHVVALPGPPRELQSMVREQLIPWCVRSFGVRPPSASITLRFLGLGQSQIDHALKQKINLPPRLITSSSFEGSRVDFTFALPEDSPQAQQTLAQLKREILAMLGDNIYAEDHTALEEVVLRRLRQRQARLALVEMGGGGALAAAFARVSPQNATLPNGWVAADEAALFRALQVPEARWQAAGEGAPRLQLAADAAAQTAGASTVLVVGPARRPDGKTDTLTAMLRVADGRWETQNFVVRGGPEGQAQLVTQLLGFLWNKLP